MYVPFVVVHEKGIVNPRVLVHVFDPGGLPGRGRQQSATGPVGEGVQWIPSESMTSMSKRFETGEADGLIVRHSTFREAYWETNIGF
jgi:hypothetical protein